MKLYNILSILVELEKGLPLHEGFDKFVEAEQQECDIKICRKFISSTVHGIEICELGENKDFMFRIGRDIMFADRDWKKLEILYPYYDKKAVSVFLIQGIYAHAIKKKIIQFHGSLISWEGKGLLFLGPSGIGKTTQAELWNTYRGAQIINGDIVFVQETTKYFLGLGSPWHGSSVYCENSCVPVHAMIVLKQGQENKIRKLEGYERVRIVSNSVFYPRWVENGMELCLDTLHHFLTHIPVFELSCLPEEEAVKLTEETVFH